VTELRDLYEPLLDRGEETIRRIEILLHPRISPADMVGMYLPDGEGFRWESDSKGGETVEMPLDT
jgi:hypothetical protein